MLIRLILGVRNKWVSGFRCQVSENKGQMTEGSRASLCGRRFMAGTEAPPEGRDASTGPTQM
jgi:hypothetical protein